MINLVDVPYLYVSFFCFVLFLFDAMESFLSHKFIIQ